MAEAALLREPSDAAPVSQPVRLEPRVLSQEEMADPAIFRQLEALSARAAEPNPFYEPWALIPAMQALNVGASVRLLVFGDGEIIAGLLPIVSRALYYHYPLPHFANWQHGNCFFGAPMIAAGCEHAFWRAVLGWADANAGLQIFLHLTGLDAAGPTWRALQAVSQAEARPAAIVHRERRALLQSDKRSDAYWRDAIRAKRRKEYRRQERRLGELGTLRFVSTRKQHDLNRWIDDFIALEAAGWKGHSHALARRASTREVFRQTVIGAAERGRLERLTLLLDGQPIAMLANLLGGRCAFAYKTTYDERYARFSPGVLLQKQNLALLDDPDIDWCDSCAGADHPMIDRIWQERREIVRVNVGIGSPSRRKVADWILKHETRPAQGVNE